MPADMESPSTSRKCCSSTATPSASSPAGKRLASDWKTVPPTFASGSPSRALRPGVHRARRGNESQAMGGTMLSVRIAPLRIVTAYHLGAETAAAYILELKGSLQRD